MTGLLSRALFEGQSVIENDIKNMDDRKDFEFEDFPGEIHTFLATPLIEPYSEEGKIRKQIIGTIILFNKVDGRGRAIRTDNYGNIGGFSSQDKRILESISPHIETIISNTRSHRELQQMSITDGLTELVNHTHFMNVLFNLEFQRSTRYGTPLSILLMDIDHFKVFNDIFGHQVGDLVLKETARIIRDNTRKVDHIARYGGEEFVVLLHNTTMKDGMSYAEKIRRKIEEGNYVEKIMGNGIFYIEEAYKRFRAILSMEDKKVREAKLYVMQNNFKLDIDSVIRLIEEKKMKEAERMIFDSFKVTMSLGLAYYPDPRVNSKKDLLTSADMLLLKAKENGRNRVEAMEL
jgi:diguanylate cyclase (GGDEF)-like protein